MKAKTVVKNKFWIMEEAGERVGTLSLNDDRYMFSSAKGKTEFFDSTKQLKKQFGSLLWEAVEEVDVKNNEVHGYPTNVPPQNCMYDVKKKLPLFSKSEKSTSLYCAGYYIIRFEKGWVKSFCPKLITVERYDYKGPFKTDLEMKHQLSIANAKRTN
jgi:hypothetical protein